MEKGHTLKDLMTFAYYVKGRSSPHSLCLTNQTKVLSQNEKETANALCCTGPTSLACIHGWQVL